MHFVLVHGFNIHDAGENSVDRLAPYLLANNHTVDLDEADYGFFNLLMVRFVKHKVLKRLAGAFAKADVIITHSNGANFTTKALKITKRSSIGALPLKLVHVSPAQNRKTGPAGPVCKMWVFHTTADKWVRLSRFLLFHPWGAQGAYGYKGTDTRVINCDFSETVKGHSDWFALDKVEYYARQILKAVEL